MPLRRSGIRKNSVRELIRSAIRILTNSATGSYANGAPKLAPPNFDGRGFGRMN